MYFGNSTLLLYFTTPVEAQQFAAVVYLCRPVIAPVAQGDMLRLHCTHAAI